MFTRGTWQHSAAVMGRKLGTLLNLTSTVKSNCIQGQKKTPSLSVQRGSKCAFLGGSQ